MNRKTIISFASILILSLLSFYSIAGQSHLQQAIKHSEAAASSADGKTIAKQAQEAKIHAEAAKNDKIDAKHVDEGIKFLEDAVKKGNDGNIDAAREAATDAVDHLKQAEK
ncbi:small metal-binding protein SmbP [Nitrosomonas supralitoralis]|uniref:Small metal-binding protein n=1 Tax=Nitrosomonas supralitoralis TaxID=2116706 RepID=A0A2P7NSR3_9PROT|nr:small metal-binding protein SmbP [Nitrosomonas supralitoralis]PSJ16468.1 hypothetical protein C7H79_13250 [Nitrosomonas supralitoralis]